jgi:crotonobetainyl-CoA:carnitine CoA-transferase CaiB-like acyl-CoA transferase
MATHRTNASPSPREGLHAPFAGLRVIDMADGKGELCGRLLAHLGADVVRVEPPEGAPSRRLPPFAPDGKTSLSFAYRNADKRGVTVDLTTADGRARLERLLASADVWIETHRPGFLASIGLAPAEVLARHPRLVVMSVTDFGQTGPYRHYAGTDMVGFAMGGMMYRAGIPERPPIVAPGALAYDATAITAAFAIAMALFQRLRTGRGQHLDCSVMESVANLADWSLPSFSQSGGYQRRAGSGIVYPIYRCADGHVRLVVLSPREWRALRAWLGEPDVIKDPPWEQLIFRLANADVLQPLLIEFFRDKQKMDLAREGQRRGIAITPVLTPAEVLSNEHATARGTFVKAHVAPGVQASVPAGFFEIDGVRHGLRRRAPALGEHNDEVFDALDRPAASGGVASSDDGAPYPFAGLRVLDFGIGAVGVEIGRLFAEYGADVIKMETSANLDFIRGVAEGNMNPPFASSNRSKRSFGVNLKAEAGRALVRRLVATADVMIENSATGVLERLGLGYDAVHALNPRLVMISSQLLGSRGPWSRWTGYGPSTHPVSGLSYLWNFPDRMDEPGGTQNIYPDHLVGRLGAFLAVAGLIDRAETGSGWHGEIAQFELPIALLGDVYLQESLTPGSAAPRGNASELGAPWGAYQCAGDDEWCVINVRGDEEWLRLRELLGPDAERPEYATAAGRLARRDELDPLVSAWTAGRSAREAMELLQARGIAAGMVQHPAQQMEDPHLAARRYHRPVEQPHLGRLVLEGPAFHGSALPEPLVGPAPGLGQHTRQICADLLAMTDGEIERLIADGVLEVPQEAPASA